MKKKSLKSEKHKYELFPIEKYTPSLCYYFIANVLYECKEEQEKQKTAAIPKYLKSCSQDNMFQCLFC